jgi:uncharacterized membrane protein YhaH (DUF805 family)
MEWMTLPLKRYADFSGRSRRKEYWMFVLGYFLTLIVATILDGILGLSGMIGPYGIFASIVILAVIVPSIAVGVRRMHDTDHSGWWLLVPIVNLIFSLTEGTSGPNRFGEDPKGAGAPDVFS